VKQTTLVNRKKTLNRAQVYSFYFNKKRKHTCFVVTQ
jgi:hypothetical protein